MLFEAKGLGKAVRAVAKSGFSMVIQPWALHASHDVYQIPEALMPFLSGGDCLGMSIGSEAARK